MDFDDVSQALDAIVSFRERYSWHAVNDDLFVWTVNTTGIAWRFFYDKSTDETLRAELTQLIDGEFDKPDSIFAVADLFVGPDESPTMVANYIALFLGASLEEVSFV